LIYIKFDLTDDLRSWIDNRNYWLSCNKKEDTRQINQRFICIWYSLQTHVQTNTDAFKQSQFDKYMYINITLNSYLMFLQTEIQCKQITFLSKAYFKIHTYRLSIFNTIEWVYIGIQLNWVKYSYIEYSLLWNKCLYSLFEYS
jgi:hypothetical protein